MTHVDELVLYAVDASPRSQAMMLRSIRSVRSFCPDLPIHAWVFARASPVLRALLDEVRVAVHERQALDDSFKTWLKWKALEDLAARGPMPSRMLILDNDVLAFDDPRRVFGAAGAARVRARIDPGAERDAQARLIGTLIVAPSIAWPLYEKVCAAVGARALEVINAGTLVCDRGMAEALASVTYALWDLKEMWRAQTLPYPSPNAWIADGVALSIAMGTSERLCFEPLRPDDAPFFIEYAAAGALRHPGVLMHTWSAYFPFALDALYGSASRRHYESELALLAQRG